MYYFSDQLSILNKKPNKYSFMIALPYKNTLLCMGSSGAVSDTTSTGVGGWIQPGCHGNP